jgi:hypothetical protein
LIKDIERGVADVLNSTVDLDDIDAAYEKDLDKQGVNSDQVDQQVSDEMQGAAGEEQTGGLGL